jgi:nucleoside triphosphate pyrophosphatase
VSTSRSRLILASASPRRREMLARVGLSFDVAPADIDESESEADASPLAYVQRIAAAKAEAVAARGEANDVVLAADTTVEIDGVVLAKAADEAEARAMLARLVGRTHRVITAFSVRGPSGMRWDEAVTTEVDMVAADGAAIEDYVASGEWRDKAGAYAVQGIAAALISRVRGSITNIAGLPLAEVLAALDQLGAAVPHYARGVPA